MDDNKCKHCGRLFSSKYTLTRHLKTTRCIGKKECICGYWTSNNRNYEIHINKCRIYKLQKTLNEKDLEIVKLHRVIEERERESSEHQFIIDQSEQEIVDLQYDTNQKTQEIVELQSVVSEKECKIQKMTIEMKQKNTEIIELKLKLANGEGQIKVYKERPGVINNQYVNKLLSVKCDTIRPFTIETVREEIQGGKYTFDQYIRAEKGLVDFISGIIAQDEQRSYVCTDSSRHKFHRLLESREWQSDNGATFLNKVFDELKEPATEYYMKICDMMRTPDEDRDMADMLMDKTKPMFFAITRPKSKDRPTLFTKVRNEVRTLAVI